MALFSFLFQSTNSMLLSRPTAVSKALRSSAPSSRLFSSLSKYDHGYLNLAVKHASIGKGHTFPNPAVGCVLVDTEADIILGAGFHPRAGFPHAEVFALFEAAGHVEDGVQAAKTVLEGVDDANVQSLAKKYASGTPQDVPGPQQTLFGGAFKDRNSVTAYVTLEPCCHYGQTPPCASSLIAAGVKRVIVGIRDPNPKVNGGGVKLLQDAGIDVVTVTNSQPCAGLVTNFFKRITPSERRKDYSWINGSKRRTLRKLAAQNKQTGTLNVISWTGSSGDQAINFEEDDDDATMQAMDALILPPSWMEHVDAVLWDHELVQLKMTSAAPKKKWAKYLGERIATVLQAHVAQVVGHSVLLYRPGEPAVIDFEKVEEE